MPVKDSLATVAASLATQLKDIVRQLMSLHFRQCRGKSRHSGACRDGSEEGRATAAPAQPVVHAARLALTLTSLRSVSLSRRERVVERSDAEGYPIFTSTPPSAPSASDTCIPFSSCTACVAAPASTIDPAGSVFPRWCKI